MRIKLFFAFLFVVVSAVFLHGLPAQAEEQQTIVVTSLSFNDKKDLKIQTEPGKQIEPLINATGVNNKNFQLYDVTHAFNSFRQTKSELNVTELDKQFLAAMTDDRLRSLPFSAKTSQTTSYGEGTTVFNVIKKDEHGYHAYLLKEIGQEATAAPMLIRLPMMDQGNELNPIHLYTKSVRKVDPVVQPKLTKEINDKKISYTYGDNIVYHAELTVPSSVTNVKSIKLVDTYDTGLRKRSAATIWLNDQKIPDTLYTETTEAQQTTYTFDPKILANYVGKTLRVEYSLQLTNEAPAQTEFTNTIKLRIEEKDILKAHQTVATGGKHFKKVEITSSKALPNAVFYLTNSEGKFLSSKAERYQWETDQTNALQLTSDQAGLFSINGLAYGNYYLHELKAPNGYVLNQEPIAFEVAKGTFEQTSDQALEIVNKKSATDSPEPVIPINNPSSPNNLIGSKNFGITPSAAKQYVATGEKIASWITILGIVLLVAVAWMSKKRSERK